VDGNGPAKSRPTEILQHTPTGLRALENADHQDAIAILPRKSHAQSYRLNGNENIYGIASAVANDGKPK
jgi:hypothetical protein